MTNIIPALSLQSYVVGGYHMVKIEDLLNFFDTTESQFNKVFRGATCSNIDGVRYIPFTDVRDKLFYGYLAD